MKTAAITSLRQKLAEGRSTFGLWVTLRDASITEMAVGLGMDWVVIDAEHGHLDWGDLVAHIRATVRSDTVALVRIAELNGALIKRVLDLGADGVVIPWIETAEQLQRALQYAKYPLEGQRGIGAERASCWGYAIAEHTSEANEHVLVVPILESVRAAQNIDALSEVPGAELFFFGPADFSATAGFRGQWEGPGVAEEILRMKDVLVRRGRHCGIIAGSAQNAVEREQQGFRMIGTGMDAGLLIRSLKSMLSAVGRDQPLRTSLQAGEPSPGLPGIEPAPVKVSGATVPAAQRDTADVPVSGVTGAEFRVGLTADFYDAAGQLKYADIGLSLLHEHPRVQVSALAEHRPEISADQLHGLNAAIVLTPRVTAASLTDSSDLLILARFGVGYDSVDVQACTAAGVLLTITAGAVDHSVAEATVGWMLALSHQLRVKDQLVREGRWNDRSQYMGRELRNRRLGLIGFGGIGRAVLKMVSGFGMAAPLVYDPFVSAEIIEHAGARSVGLDELLSEADFVSLHCPLNEQTRGLIGRRELSLMKRESWIINTARGGMIDEDALYDVLRDRRIAGAALDCFAVEPVLSPGPLAQLDNVLLAPHCIAWTEELFREIGRTACRGIVDLLAGRRPHGVVNPDVLQQTAFLKKLERLTDRSNLDAGMGHSHT